MITCSAVTRAIVLNDAKNDKTLYFLAPAHSKDCSEIFHSLVPAFQVKQNHVKYYLMQEELEVIIAVQPWYQLSSQWHSRMT